MERPLRLWGKADADARLAHATAEAGDLAVMAPGTSRRGRYWPCGSLRCVRDRLAWPRRTMPGQPANWSP
ncbi:hypothetical protein AWV80_33555 [Cupriavidus sp. UYMU48A]|nr:hypothetical protein AWV80_33555 [Cupriavidus sp. UYMU48A]